MVRASSAHRITTNRPFFDMTEFNTVSEELSQKAKAKKETYNGSIEDAVRLQNTPGLKTIASSVVKLHEKRELAISDPLPEGAKTYAQELYLENNYNFFDPSINDLDIGLRKGKYAEDNAIKVLNQLLSTNYLKNEDRKEIDILGGTADIIQGKTVRDVKCPNNWKTFRKKDGIETAYYWQLISYCYLYGCEEAYLDYILMPMPEELEEFAVKGMSSNEVEKFMANNEAILNLPLERRVKTYKLEANIQKEIAFLKSRLEKFKEYYSTLTYEICMNITT